MASAVLKNIQEEVTCPICLELLKEPVSADCGHTFCHACITLNYESTKDQEGEGSCPVCRVSYQFGNLRPNRHVANIVERLKGADLSPEKEQEVHHCARHGEKLQLFCERDKKVICWLCERSQEHRGHQTFLIEEVVQEYKEKLQKALKKLKTDEEEFENWEYDLQDHRTLWQKQIQSDVQNVQEQFKRLRDILDSEEKKEQRKLEQEEERILSSLAESETNLVRQRELVRNLISDLEHQMEASAIEMLLIFFIPRYETLTLKKPKHIPRGQRRAFQAPDLTKVLQTFQGEEVQVTLTQSNNPNIEVSEDHRQLTYHKRKNFSFWDQDCQDGILGNPAILSGKHYWEVDVSRKYAWFLGLNDGRCIKPVFVSMGESSNVKQYTNYQPKCGYWIIGLNNESSYNAFDETPFTYDSRLFNLFLTNRPSRIGVFLDYKAGTLSFYDVSNNGVLIYRFSACSFPKRVFPYFNLRGCVQPMTVCWPNS
uniref:Uncharacterized protein n=1 Tax=Nannospalax galili TaxID=1026970 RepID=A0A8C6S0T3_NANGA